MVVLTTLGHNKSREAGEEKKGRSKIQEEATSDNNMK